MSWVKLDDQFPIHRKVDNLSDPAFRLHVSALCWCNRNLTDGAIPATELESAAPRTMKRPEKFVAELVDRCLWESTGSYGWVIKDYLTWQNSKDDVARKRRQAAERQQRWRDHRTAGEQQ